MQNTSQEDWVTQYERLRSQELEPSANWEQTLFVRQGMAAWMKARPARDSRPSKSVVVAPACNQPLPIGIASDAKRELTCELVNLILHREQEVVA